MSSLSHGWMTNHHRFELLAQLGETLHLWRRRRQQRQQLAELTERELHDFAHARLPAFKVPRKIVIVREIPKGPTGKLQRIGLAKRLGLAE